MVVGLLRRQFNKKYFLSLGASSVVEHLPSMCEDPDSNMVWQMNKETDMCTYMHVCNYTYFSI